MECFSQNSDHNFTGSESGSETEVILASNRPKKRAGRRVFKETRHPVFRGVRKRNSDKWVCELRQPNKKTRIWLGTYPTPEMAARAHDVAALALRGKSACLNFADSSWRLPKPASKDSVEIRRAAAEAAESFRPRQSGDGGAEDVEEEAGFQRQEYGKGTDERGAFCIDSEGVSDMQDWLAVMAEEPLMSPPRCVENYITLDDVESFADVSLWSYSI